jgi:hypothetical protein
MQKVVPEAFAFTAAWMLAPGAIDTPLQELGGGGGGGGALQAVVVSVRETDGDRLLLVS